MEPSELHKLSGVASRAESTTMLRVGSGLHVCPACDSSLVYPTEWERAGGTRWRVDLRCPNCEWTASGLFNQRVLERFDEELDRGTEALVGSYKSLLECNLADEVDRFVGALETDAILPEDF